MKSKNANEYSERERKIRPITMLVLTAAVAAIYVVTSIVLNFASFGLVQFRVSEVLTILPVFAPIAPIAITGLTLGCFLSNMIGLFMGVNPAGVWDLLLGSLATLLAAWLTYLLRGIKFKGLPVLAILPPILINALVVGTELALVLYGGSDSFGAMLIISILQVGLGQLVMCGVGGLILYNRLDRLGALKMLHK